MAKSDSPIVGLDIGTGSVRVVMAEVIDGEVEIVGLGEVESRGLRRGVISRPDLAVEAIRRAVESAERSSGLRVSRVCVGLAGSQIHGENNQGRIAVPGRHREITREDLDRAIETACAIPLQAGREIADVLPQEYTVDDQDGIDDPLGMLGSRLAVSVHILTSPVAAKQSIISSVNRAGFHVTDVYLSHLASAEAVLSDDDREYGSAAVNIGAETTSLAIFQRGAVRHSAVFPLGGSHFTNDIAVGLRTSIPEAERIKRASGCASRLLLDEQSASAPVEVPAPGGKSSRLVSRQILCEILEPRAEEVFAHVQEEIRRSGFDRQLSSGIVLTGGGALLAGVIEVAEQVFNAPVRLGFPEDIVGFGDQFEPAAFSTAVGLALHGAHREMGAGEHTQRRSSDGSGGSGFTDRVKSFFGIR